MNRSVRKGKSVKRFERSNGLDTALYKNYLYLFTPGGFCAARLHTSMVGNVKIVHSE